MKRLISGLLITILVSIFGCQTQNSLIESQFSYKGKFSEYKSFGFLNNPNIYGLEKYDRNLIENMIFKRFISMGYSYNEAAPDLLVGYTYFKEGVELVMMQRGDLKTWEKKRTGNYLSEDDRYEQRRTVSKNGTLSIYFLERKNSTIVFQANFKDYQQDQSDYQIISSVGRIMDKYQVTSY